MSPSAIAALSFLFVLAGILLGSLARKLLPGEQVTPEAKDVVRLSLGIVMSLSALVLGLLVASAKGGYEMRRSEINEITANVVLIDYLLATYGEDAKGVRVTLREEIPAAVDRIWSEGRLIGETPMAFSPLPVGEQFYSAVLDLKPADESQRELRGWIVQSAHELSQQRLMLYSLQGSSIPVPFLAVLYLWIVVLFAGYSLMGPGRAMPLTFMILCGLSVSGAVFLILELDQPFSGIMMLSKEPLLKALSPLQ